MGLPNLQTDTSIQEETDTLGGFRLLNSGVHDAIIDMAYLDESKGGAWGLNIIFKTMDGATINKTGAMNAIYMTGGTAKGCLNYYVDKNGKKQYLPGFNIANAIALLTLGEEIGNITPETKTINIYNYELKKDVPTQKQVLVPLIGQTLKLGILREKHDKTADSGSVDTFGNKIYAPTGETFEKNEIAKIFNDAGLTVTELKAGESTDFMSKWQEANKDKIVDKSSGAKTPKAAGAAGMPTPNTSTTPLFGGSK